MRKELAEEVERAVTAHQRVEEYPELPDDGFERSWTAIAAYGADALEPLKVLLADDDAHRRATAGYLLGRLGEAHEMLRAQVRDELLRAATVETEDSVVHALAAGTSLSDLSNAEALGLLRSTNANLRRIAAYNLGMVVSSDHEDEPIRAELRTAAASDPDSEVRWWAQFGLDTSRDDGPLEEE